MIQSTWPSQLAQNLHGAFRYLFHFSPLLGTLIFMFLFYLQNRISVLLSQTTSLCALKLHCLIQWAHLHCISLPPAHPPSPLYCALFPAEYCTPPWCWADTSSGAIIPILQGVLLSPAIPRFIPLWREPVFLTAGNKGRCQNPLLVFSELERCYSLVRSVSLKVRPMCQQFNSLFQITLQHN